MLPVDAYGGMEGGSKGQEGKNSLSAILTGIHKRMGKKVGEESTGSYTDLHHTTTKVGCVYIRTMPSLTYDCTKRDKVINIIMSVPLPGSNDWNQERI